MVKVADAELLAHAERIQGKVLLITGKFCRRYALSGSYAVCCGTGGGSGIGRETAILYGKYGYESLAVH
jgi:hypothetical protein